MSNIGKEIKDFYCNGFFGRRYDLSGSRIEGEGHDWLVVRIADGEDAGNVACATFNGNHKKEEYLADWLDPSEECCQ